MILFYFSLFLIEQSTFNDDSIWRQVLMVLSVVLIRRKYKKKNQARKNTVEKQKKNKASFLSSKKHDLSPCLS